MSVEVLRDSGNDAVYSALPRPFAWVIGFEHSAVWLGAATGAGYLLVEFSAFAALGRPTGMPWADLFATYFTYALCFAGPPIAIAILVRGLERDARDLAPVLSAEEGGDAPLYREALTVAPRAVWLGVVAGVLVAIPFLWVQLGMLSSMHAGMLWTLFVTLREITLDVAWFGVLGWAVGVGLRLSQLTEERARPDLLDRGSFAALARNGTRFSAVWLVYCAIGVPAALVIQEAFSEVARSMMLIMLVLACFAGVALILPCRGAHRVLRSAKRSELEQVRSQIAEARRTREDTRLQGLLAWEARIEGLSEWPIDAAALGRTGLFVLLPLASWVASALVERLVEVSLD